MRSSIVLNLLCAACSLGVAADIEVPVGGDIQAAIDHVAAEDQGGTVILKAGEHSINAPLKMKSNVALCGEAKLASTLSTTNDIKIITASTNGLTNLAIRNLVIVGANSLHGGGIHLVSYGQNHQNITVSGVHVFETGWGVHIKGAEDVTIENCNFSRNGTKGKEGYAHNLYLRRCYSAIVTNCTLTNSISSNGINISYSKSISICNCKVTGNHFRGIRAADTDGFRVHDCVIAKNGAVGLLANTEKVVTRNIDWQNNLVFDNGAEGIYARNGATGICKNNNAYGNKKGDYRLPTKVSQSDNVSDPEMAEKTAAAEDNHSQVTEVRLSPEDPQWVVSKYLTGTHFVYAFEEDWIYRDDTVIDWMKRAKVGVIRYPGGTAVMHWHWDRLNGYAFEHHVKKLTGKLGPADTWDPDYKPLPKRDPKDYMDVDEYIEVCRRVDADPMIGLNILSGAKFHRVEAGKEEARRLAAHCKAKGYDVPFWYIGNEGYAKGIWGKKYIQAIDEYGAIVKETFPDAKIIADWKYGPKEKKRFEHSLEIIAGSKLINVMEYHEKWGNDWGLYSGKTREEWLSQKPFLYNGQFSEFYKKFAIHNQEIGRDIKHAHNEWGIGGIQGSKDAFDFTLLTADFFIEIFRHPTYMACCWNLNAGPKWSRAFVVEDDKVTLMPPAYVYEMVAPAMGQTLIPMEVTGNDAVYGFAVMNTKSGVTRTYLMNKSERPAFAALKNRQGMLEVQSILRLVHPGKMILQKSTEPGAKVALAPMSFTLITALTR